MKKFRNSLLVIALSLFAFNANSQVIVKKYEAEWKKVESFVNKQLPQSAMTEVKKIYALAKKDKQDAQIIKSLLYITQLNGEIDDNAGIFAIKEFEKEIPQSKEPATSILNNMLADLYWQYYQNHRWDLYNRTQTTSFKKDDIATWGAEDFHKKISELYLLSLKNEKLLQQTNLPSFDAIITKGNVRHLRPTLFDLLAQCALEYFKNDERDVNKPAYAFEIDQASAFDPAADFINRKFPTKDSLSLHHKALLLYQQLIRFHLNDTRHDALIDIDIDRIEFVKSKTVHPDKDDLYIHALNHIASQYESLPAAAQASYLIAQYYDQKANEYKPYGDSTHRLDRVKAKAICEKILLQKDSSEGRINCHNLLQQINTKSLQFSVEKVNLPAQPFRSLVSYRNFNTLYLRLIKADETLKKNIENQYDNKFWSTILAATPLKNWQQALPVTTDLQEHNVEIKIDALPAGEYLLMAGTDKNMNSEKTILGARLFYVSTISFASNKDDFFVLNRDNGKPLAAASVQVWEQKYDYSTAKYARQKTELYKTDANGFFHLNRKTDANNRYNYSYQLDISHNKERLFMNDMINDYYYSNIYTETKAGRNIYFFTDRSIYRPGQTVYFKGIVITSSGTEKSDIVTGYENVIYLQDVNSQRVDSLKVITNEYGSFSGKFQLPQTGVTGQFTILPKKDQGNTFFSVEEYKRPKFSVDYDTLKGTYKVNDNIKVTGIAKAYAGNNIDGAVVKYRVVREARFLYPGLFSRWWLPRADPLEIIHGETTTDKDGKFTVEFTAMPDLKIDKKFDPTFDYVVYADVTDINGETRSGENRVSVSYKALILRTDIPVTLPADSLKTLSIRTENLNGQFEPANVKVNITRLKEEKRLIRQRYWSRPDQFIFSKEEYIRYFPYDEYDNEDDYQSWEKAEQVFEKTDSAGKDSRFELSNLKLAPGIYAIEISSKDKNGELVRDVKYIQLYDEKNNQLPRTQYLWTEGTSPIQPGETTAVKLGSSADNLFIIQTLDRKSAGKQTGVNSYTFFTLNSERKKIDFTATEADRGGYGAGWVFVKHNRVYQYSDIIRVTWNNKDLTIEYATFRDKTLPGSEEKWKLKISGYKKEKVAAEMLGSMYDASLDQFTPHNWTAPSIWSFYSSAMVWNGTTNFIKQDAILKPYNEIPDFKNIAKFYDRLLSGIYDQQPMASTARGRLHKETMISYTPPAMQAVGNVNIGVDKNMQVATEISYDGLPNGFASFPFAVSPDKQKNDNEPGNIQPRKNFNETAFFFPDLRTDSEGNIEFSFTLPEALTKWKFQALAHTKDLAFGYSSNEIVTQKQLMVQPNAPRFLREGDKMEFSSKVVNLSDKELKGQAELQLFDATTNEPVDSWFKNMIRTQAFTLPAGQSSAVKFPMEIPVQFNKALIWRIVAKASHEGEGLEGAFSDGEENAMPVLTNRMLVTETMSLPVRGSGTKNFSFDKLLQSGNSKTLQQYALTVEYTSNPAWYAVQALPYLMEYPYDCAEQTWNRYYANSLAAFIANSSPRIKSIFDEWSKVSPEGGDLEGAAALMSNLQKNEELKSVLLEETPWVLQAKTEAEQKKNIALLFDMVRMSRELNSSYEKLKQMQSSNGGFVWFKGGPDDGYITQYIITGIGHLKKLKGIAAGQDAKLKQILDMGIPYLDKKLKEDYDNLVKSKTDLKKYDLGYSEIQYLYMRSFFPEYKIAGASQTAYNYFKSRLPLNWTKQNKYMQGMIALALSRTGDAQTPAAILRSLKETSISNAELGMYWKDAQRSWWWYEAPVERQALLIEAFQEIGKDTKTADDLRTWLLKNKQTNNWESTKATAEACYALLLQGTQWLNADPSVTIQLGSTTIQSTGQKQEAGTGYFKKTIEGEKVKPEMGNISVTVGAAQGNPGGVSWGGVYWQYFEDLDKITTAATPLSLVKKLFVETNSDRGPVLTPVNNGDKLKVGDKIKIRIELRADREMEYVHMKDMRASCLEPVNVLSGYKWQNSLGYYESTKDASTSFFFSNLRKGTYVFEYPLFVTHTGNFSNGVTSIQCMYAPEFSSHSEGIRINVQ